MDINALKSQAMSFRKNGRWINALEIYQEVSVAIPEDWDSWVGLGDTLLNMEKWEDAVEAYRHSIKLKEEFDWAWHNLAVALGKLSRWDEVSQCHVKLQELKPDFWEINREIPLVANHLADFLAHVEQKLPSQKIKNDVQGIAYEQSISSTEDVWAIESKMHQQLRKENKSLDVKTSIVSEETANNVYIDKMFKVAGNLFVAIAKLEIPPNNLKKAFIQSPLFDRPFLGFALDKDPKCLLFALVIDSDQLENACISIFSPQESQLKFHSKTVLYDDIHAFLAELSSQEASKLLNIFFQCGLDYADQSSSAEFARNYKLCHSACAKPGLLVEYGTWLSPHVLYFEANITDRWLLGDYELAIVSDRGCRVSHCQTFQISHTQLAGVAVLGESIYRDTFQEFWVDFWVSGSLVLLDKPITLKQYSLEFIQYLNSRSNHQKGLIQENLNKSLILLSRDHSNREESAALVKKLQRYIPFSPVNAIDSELPFQIFFDQVIPISCDGIFVSGWMHDPYESLEEIEAVTALGFRFSLSACYVYRTERHDVREHLSQTRYGRFDAKPGFFAYIQSDEVTRNLLQDFEQFHSVRFSIKLKDKVTIDVTPDIKYCDVFTARSIVSQIVTPDQVNEDMLKNCISPAAGKLQELCMKQVSIQQVIEIGNLCEKPTVSIIIPLYKRLDFLKVQVPLFANDETLHNCEIIYVLDSPWQAQELTSFLQEHCQLYELPVKIVIMKRNSGYSASNNAGASQAKGKYFLLMNSDVFPCSSGWINKMVEFYQSSPRIGTVGAKLVYEDGSIQHAGMFFEKTTFPFWLTLHYFKGFPNQYEPANTTRLVPSVTGACLLISREIFENIDGMSTEYVIGDFEDSDLCFKCVQKGYENWYYPEVEFYHLERQSVPLNASYTGSLAWRHNAQLHEKKWGNLITEIMRDIS